MEPIKLTNKQLAIIIGHAMLVGTDIDRIRVPYGTDKLPEIINEFTDYITEMREDFTYTERVALIDLLYVESEVLRKVLDPILPVFDETT